MQNIIKILIFTIFLLLISIIAGWNLNINKPIQTSGLQAQDILNVSYGAHAKQTMDVYLPKNRDVNTKIIGIIHGGGWLAGDKGDLTYFAKLLRDKGFAVVNINYRLAGTNEKILLSSQLEDINLGLHYASKNSTSWNVSNKFGLLGHSAGGYLSLMYAYTYNDDKVKTVVSMAAPTDLTDPEFHNISGVTDALSFLIGEKYESAQEKWSIASPIYNVNEKSVPTLIFQGKKDELVPYLQTQQLYKELKAKNVMSKMFLYENANHAFQNANFFQIKSEIIKWFQMYI